MVYVDRLISYSTRPFGHFKWCHLTADTEEELHSFAKRLGLKKSWFQNKCKPHYDITENKREQAIDLGAIEI